MSSPSSFPNIDSLTTLDLKSLRNFLRKPLASQKKTHPEGNKLELLLDRVSVVTENTPVRPWKGLGRI